MKFSMLSLLRPVAQVAIGVSLGFTLSLLSVSLGKDPCDFHEKSGNEAILGQGGDLDGARKPNSVPIARHENGETEDDFIPRIIPYIPARQSEPKKLFRTRYISTELRIYERLFVGVLTSEDTISTLGVAVNQTISHHLDAVVFFTGTLNHRIPLGMTVVTHGDERHVRNMFQTVRYVLEKYNDMYDWFYFSQDDTYTEAGHLKALIGHLSMNLNLYMGHPQELIENCQNDILSSRPDEWLGRCIVNHLKINCVDEHEGLAYYHYKMGKKLDLNIWDNLHFKNIIAVHPVSDPELMYRLHKMFTEIELQRTYQEIEKLQAEIKNISEVAFEGDKSTQWPTGVNPPFEPKTHFEVLKWEYFTENELYFCADGSPKCELRGINKLDITDIIEVAMEELNKKYKPILQLKKQQLVNGYRRFDPTRGMEYTLDLQLEVVSEKGRSCSIMKRVHLLRPLSKVEIVPMPFVSEAAQVHIVLPMTVHDLDYASRFLDLYVKFCFERSENAILTLLFIYNPLEAQQIEKYDIFANIKAKIVAYEQEYPREKIPWVSVRADNLSQIKIVDVISKKLPVDTLLFIASVNTNINSEFLSHCRLNSISNWQVFFPIHFQGYNPDIAFHNKHPPFTIDLVKDSGYFDRNIFDEACFYNSDYMAARSSMAPDVQENEDLLDTLDLYDMFLNYSKLHVFRAVEPNLRQSYRHQKCDRHLGEEMYSRCVQSNLNNLGSHFQLATMLFELQRGNST
ncbi:chondroitin sulfate synthase 2 isoform X2 [Brienomyrus brachyistius]|uniref:chondroitin sulfate synthase 2 isoform X2 n=1 Tax=Brienomyrus brachyistius TaxID=42636 RepID=UPI0020B228BE|nr:chondroitin sulfate synthase 2 isoform X2 [Brienomyrus brachyistius]